MDRAARESGCGVPWQLLAAIARVESDFGRNMATSSAGAIGYGQFLPSSWQAFGNDGNVYDYRAALPAIATYLCQNGLARDPRAALFAYNHADWYVDLVLDLAVRYDRMAPGAPTPDVLALNPAFDESIPMHYAPGRDIRLQSRARTLDGQTRWLGVPWRSRPPGSSISPSTLDTTTLAMLRAAFDLAGNSPQPASPRATLLSSLVDRAWAGGLLANPSALGGAWSVAEIRQRVERGQPIVAMLGARLLPGHPPTAADAGGDLPILVIGATADGLVVSDPSFSSSLGYGLEVSDAAFVKAWQAATAPLQALAFSTRPAPPPRDDHTREAVSPQVAATSELLAKPTVAVRGVEDEAEVAPPLRVSRTPGTASAQDAQGTANATRDDPDRSWLILAAAAIYLGAALALRQARSRRSP
jgi:hypothetical protein